MLDMGIVQGSEAQAKPLIIGKDTVYVHTNIHKIEKPVDEMGGEMTSDLYEYNEVQYTLEEWQEMQESKDNIDIEAG